MDEIDKYDLCSDCVYAMWDCYEGYSAKECGLPNAKEWFLDGCTEDCMPYYDDDEECWCCNNYVMRREF